MRHLIVRTLALTLCTSLSFSHGSPRHFACYTSSHTHGSAFGSGCTSLHAHASRCTRIMVLRLVAPRTGLRARSHALDHVYSFLSWISRLHAHSLFRSFSSFTHTSSGSSLPRTVHVLDLLVLSSFSWFYSLDSYLVLRSSQFTVCTRTFFADLVHWITLRSALDLILHACTHHSRTSHLSHGSRSLHAFTATSPRVFWFSGHLARTHARGRTVCTGSAFLDLHLRLHVQSVCGLTAPGSASRTFWFTRMVLRLHARTHILPGSLITGSRLRLCTGSFSAHLALFTFMHTLDSRLSFVCTFSRSLSFAGSLRSAVAHSVLVRRSSFSFTLCLALTWFVFVRSAVHVWISLCTRLDHALDLASFLTASRTFSFSRYLWMFTWFTLWIWFRIIFVFAYSSRTLLSFTRLHYSFTLTHGSVTFSRFSFYTLRMDRSPACTLFRLPRMVRSRIVSCVLRAFALDAAGCAHLRLHSPAVCTRTFSHARFTHVRSRSAWFSLGHTLSWIRTWIARFVHFAVFLDVARCRSDLSSVHVAHFTFTFAHTHSHVRILTHSLDLRTHLSFHGFTLVAAWFITDHVVALTWIVHVYSSVHLCVCGCVHSFRLGGSWFASFALFLVCMDHRILRASRLRLRGYRTLWIAHASSHNSLRTRSRSRMDLPLFVRAVLDLSFCLDASFTAFLRQSLHARFRSPRIVYSSLRLLFASRLHRFRFQFIIFWFSLRFFSWFVFWIVFSFSFHSLSLDCVFVFTLFLFTLWILDPRSRTRTRIRLSVAFRFSFRLPLQFTARFCRLTHTALVPRSFLSPRSLVFFHGLWMDLMPFGPPRFTVLVSRTGFTLVTHFLVLVSHCVCTRTHFQFTHSFVLCLAFSLRFLDHCGSRVSLAGSPSFIVLPRARFSLLPRHAVSRSSSLTGCVSRFWISLCHWFLVRFHRSFSLHSSFLSLHSALGSRIA